MRKVNVVHLKTSRNSTGESNLNRTNGKRGGLPTLGISHAGGNSPSSLILGLLPFLVVQS